MHFKQPSEDHVAGIVSKKQQFFIEECCSPENVAQDMCLCGFFFYCGDVEFVI